MKWSVSVHHALRRCERQAFFGQVIASPISQDPLRREAYILKQLSQEEAWRGQVIHRIMATEVARTLGDHRAEIDSDELTSAAVELGQRQLDFSSKRRYRTEAKSRVGADFAALFAHDYGYGLSEDPITDLRDTARTCFKNLAEWDQLLTHLASADQLQVEQPHTVRIAGVTVAVTPDLVAIHRGRWHTIVDWKVAASLTSNYSMQLLVYGLAALHRPSPEVRPNQLLLSEANLLTGVITKFPLDSVTAAETEDLIFRSAGERDALFDAPESQDLLERLADLDVAHSAGTCATCGFRKLCLDALSTPRSPELEAVQGVLV
jgi:hypothetical protein